MQTNINIETRFEKRRKIHSRTDYDTEGNIILQRTADFRLKEIPMADGTVYYAVMGMDGMPIHAAHQYLNQHLLANRCSDNTRRKYASVLVKLYSFCYLMDFEIGNLGSEGVHQLVAFLQENGPSACSNETVNSYLAMIREYFNYYHIENPTLFAKHLIEQSECALDGIAFTSKLCKYDINLKTNPYRQNEVPRYISEDDYKKLITEAQKDKDWTAVMLMHLMFRYGMRLGECLGLTEEDVVTMPINGRSIPTLIVRNRLTDKPDQKAKVKFVPNSKNDYNNPSYIKEWRKDPYSHYYLNESADFFPALQRFVKSMHEMGEQHPEKYKTSVADIVCPKECTLEENHYIFLNHLGKRLSAQNWNKKLRTYFTRVGISVDSGSRQNNLSHRFRHGFAMMHAPYMTPAELKELMHHRSISSTMVYFNPTQEDKYNNISALENDIYKDCPGLASILGNAFKK